MPRSTRSATVVKSITQNNWQKITFQTGILWLRKSNFNEQLKSLHCSRDVNYRVDIAPIGLLGLPNKEETWKNSLQILKGHQIFTLCSLF